MMSSTKPGLLYGGVCFDDDVVYNGTLEEHVEHLGAVF